MSIEAAAWWLARQVFASLPARVLAGVLGLLVLGYAVYLLAKIPGLVRDVADLKRDRLRPEEFARVMREHARRQDKLADGIERMLDLVGPAATAGAWKMTYAAVAAVAPSAEVQAREWESRPGREGDQG